MFVDFDTGCRPPKRGDLVYSNIGNRRMRTWIILRSRLMRRAKHPYRFRVWMARWWEIEVDMRMKLYQSAERNGGQNVLYFRRYPAKKRRRKPLPWELA